jgi:hypothetical protein
MKRARNLDAKTLLYVAAQMRRHGAEVQRFAGRRAPDLWVYLLKLDAKSARERCWGRSHQSARM